MAKTNRSTRRNGHAANGSRTSIEPREMVDLRADLISYGVMTLGFSKADAERTADIAVEAILDKSADSE